MDLVRKFKGREFGFVVYKERDSDQVWLSTPAGGESEDEVDMGSQRKEMRSQLERVHPTNTAFVISKLHFHGNRGFSGQIIVPTGSTRDLGAASADRGWNESAIGIGQPPIEIIGMNDREEADLLIFQEPITYRPMQRPAIRDEIDFTLQELSSSRTATQQDVMDALRHYGYKTMLAGTVGQRLRDEDLKSLSQMFTTTELLGRGKPVGPEPDHYSVKVLVKGETQHHDLTKIEKANGEVGG
jgi:hypothetical protein